MNTCETRLHLASSAGLLASETTPASSPLSALGDLLAMSLCGGGLDEGLIGGGDTARSGDRTPLATAFRPALQVSDISFWKPFTLLRSWVLAALFGANIACAWLLACRRSCSAEEIAALAFSSAALKPSNLHHQHYLSSCTKHSTAQQTLLGAPCSMLLISTCQAAYLCGLIGVL